MLINIILCTITFILTFMIIFITNHLRIKKSKYEKLLFIGYFISRFKLDKKKINYKYLNFGVCLINSFIISFTALAVMTIDTNKMWQYLIAFVLLAALMYSLYEIYGQHLVKKGWKK